MPTDNSFSPAIKLAYLAALLAMVVGALALSGWAFDLAALKSVLPGRVAMKANTAICFILIGIELLLSVRLPATIKPQFVFFLSGTARLCGLIVGLISLLTLCEYMFDWNPGFDQWLFREPEDTVGTSVPGRMAPETALCFLLLAAALWLASGPGKTRLAMLSSVVLGLLVTILALVAGLSYPTPGLGAYGWFGLTIMAMHTAMTFVMLGMAVIALNWQQDVMQWSLNKNTTVAFICGMAVLILIGFNTNRSQFRLGEINRKIAYSEKAQSYVESIVINIIDAHAHTRGYIITGDKQFKAHYLEGKANINLNLDELRKLIVVSSHQKQQFIWVEAQTRAQLQWFQQVIDTRQTRMTDAARNNMIRNEESLLDNFRRTYSQVKNEHQHFIKELKQESESASRFLYIIIAVGTLLSLLIFLIVIFRLNASANDRKRAENVLRKLSQAVEQSPSAIIITDLDANIEYVNEGFVKVTGYSGDEVIGQNPRLLSSGKTPGETYKDMWDSLKRGEIWKGEFINRRKDGSEYNESVLVSPVRQPDGRVTNYLAIKEDITLFKQAQEALRDSRENLHRLLNSMAEGAYGVDTNGICTFVNRAFLQMLGYQSENEVLGKHTHELMHHSHADGSPYLESECKVYRAYHTNKSSHVLDEVFWSKDGVAVPVEYWSYPIVSDGVVTGTIVTFIDITERKNAEANLAEQLDELRRWHDATSGRESRIIELKHEVNELLGKSGLPPRYPSAESQDQTEK